MKSKIKNELCSFITSYIRQEKYTHKDVSEICGVPRSRITNIVAGNHDKMTIDYLIDILFCLGFSIKFSTSDDSITMEIKKIK